jgi:tol-pal system protein YbgF
VRDGSPSCVHRGEVGLSSLGRIALQQEYNDEGDRDAVASSHLEGVMRLRSLLAAVSLAIVLPAHAQLFADDDARKAILQLRGQITALQQRDTELTARLERLESAQRNQLELVNQIESMRQENARLRGQIEALANEVATLQKRNRDLYADLDARLKKMEPTSVTVDGRTAAVDRDELAAYEAPLAQFRAGDFKGSLPGFQHFVARYPQSAYAAAAQYWIGSAFYAVKDYKSAITAHRTLVERYADSPRVPDALLSIAESQVQLGDRKSANATLARIIKEYPDTEAARIAKERLPATRQRRGHEVGASASRLREFAACARSGCGVPRHRDRRRRGVTRRLEIPAGREIRTPPPA